MSDFPKLIVFSDKAIPRVRSTYKGATIEEFNLQKFTVDPNNQVTSLINIAGHFDELGNKKRATVISGYTEEHFTFFSFSNTTYSTLIVESSDDYVVLPAFEDAMFCLYERDLAVNTLIDSSLVIFSVFKYLETINFKKIDKKNSLAIVKANDVSEEMHYALQNFFFNWYKVQIL